MIKGSRKQRGFKRKTTNSQSSTNYHTTPSKLLTTLHVVNGKSPSASQSSVISTQTRSLSSERKPAHRSSTVATRKSFTHAHHNSDISAISQRKLHRFSPPPQSMIDAIQDFQNEGPGESLLKVEFSPQQADVVNQNPDLHEALVKNREAFETIKQQHKAGQVGEEAQGESKMQGGSDDELSIVKHSKELYEKFPALGTLPEINQHLLLNHPHPNRPLRILFFGGSDIGAETLESLKNAMDPSHPINKHRPYPLVGKLEVVTTPPVKLLVKKAVTVHPDGSESEHHGGDDGDDGNHGINESSKPKVVKRRVEVQQFSGIHTKADLLGLPIHHLPSREKIGPDFQLPSDDFDLGVVISFDFLIPQRIIKAFPMQMINAHASLLPKYSGAAPMQYAIINNERKTGVSIITLSPKTFDAGHILLQKTIPITSTTTYLTLHNETADVAADAVVETIASWNTMMAQAVQQAPLIQRYKEFREKQALQRKAKTTTSAEKTTTDGETAQSQTDTTTTTTDAANSLMSGDNSIPTGHDEIIQNVKRLDLLKAPKIRANQYVQWALMTDTEVDNFFRGLYGTPRNLLTILNKKGDEEASINDSHNHVIIKALSRDQPIGGGNVSGTDTHTLPRTVNHQVEEKINQLIPTLQPGDAFYDSNSNAVRVLCANRKTVALTQFLSSTGKTSDARAYSNGNFTKNENGIPVSRFVTYFGNNETSIFY